MIVNIYDCISLLHVFLTFQHIPGNKKLSSKKFHIKMSELWRMTFH